MAGYIGTKAVLLSTTAATVTGNADIGGDLTVDSNTLYVDAANNRVGVGTASPSNPFQVGTSDLIVDSSGNLLVGTTDSSPGNNSGSGNNGIALKENGSLQVARTDADAGQFNRLNSDGDIALFRKDGTTVGSIGSLFTTASRFYIAGEGLTTGILFGSNQVDPMRNGALIDNSVDLGESSYRYDDVYATNGTIQTSDRNEKQDIAELDEAEKRVAVAAKGLIRKYRWKDAVADKGDEARIHVGIIAQDLQDAFAAEGLDAGRYAMFISSTWWEHDGQTYETAEEAPEGAVERTRMGVRYPELLAFIIGAM